MSIYFKVASMLVACVALSACVSTSSTGGSAIVEVSASPAELLTAEDFPEPDTADFNAALTLVSDDINNRLIGQQTPANVIFTVWGFDELAADASATKLKESAFDVRPQSVPYFLRFDKSDIDSIEFQSGQPDSIKYYITVGVDVDADGIICNGDYRQDYAVTPPERFAVTQTDVQREASISEISGEICPD